MEQTVSTRQRVRKDFGRIGRVIQIPDLMEMQLKSYERFLQRNVPPNERGDVGLQGVFKSVFPIKDFSGTSSLEFVGYSFGEPKYSMEECLQRDMTYEVPLKITVRLVAYDVDKFTGGQGIRDIKEQEIYFGAIPLMTARGTFIINGTERVIVSQLQRSPGIFFDHDQGKTHSSGKILYSARVIPVRGSWIDFEFDHKDILYVRIDRRRKFPVTTLLKALGYSGEQLLNYFYKMETIFVEEDGTVKKAFVPGLFVGKKALQDICDPRNGEVLVKKNRKITRLAMNKMEEAGIRAVPLDFEDIKGSILAHDIVDPVTGEILITYNDEINEANFNLLREKKISSIETLYIDGLNVSSSLRDTLLLDKVNTKEEAIMDIYRRLRPSSIPTPEIAQAFFKSLFFSPETYDLSEVGRFKLNLRLKLDSPLTQRTLKSEDLFEAVRLLIDIKDTQGPVDDIDHLGNRRVRAVGELVENQYRIGLVRMERAIKERMSLQEIEAVMPHDLINPKPVSSVVKEFFGTSQLSQFMDQTNPLSEVTHERRLSALGPGGLSRERAGFEVRDVHPTHYGRICPVETPEGPNIGLIVSLSTYAKVNHYGFIETPYREVANAAVTKNVKYLTALDEQDHAIAQANVPMDKKGRFSTDIVSARRDGEFVMVNPEEVTFMDVSPNQLVSVAASLIPFLENDDANRALMGSNMQRQAVPLLKTSAPLVGTGLEDVVARDSGATAVAKGDGYVEEVDANRIVVRYEDGGDSASAGVEIYKLIKFQKSNQNTCINQKPIVRSGDFVRRGQVIADGPATEKGELALGKNVMVAFMPWGGYNFEDSILVSERIAQEDVFTSIHIEQFETVARDTKLGKEEISRDIPNVGEEALNDLDDSGIIRIGAEVKPGDILVGKVTPKGETQLSPEEKLLRAIFGEKAGDVKDTSLRVPPGIEGIVLDAKVFSRRGIDKDERSKSIEDEEIVRLRRDEADQLAIIEKNTRRRLEKILVGETIAVSVKDLKGKMIIRKGETISADAVSRVPLSKIREITLPAKSKVEPEVEKILDSHNEQVELIKMIFDDKINRLKKGDELPPGVIKMVKVYIAVKRKLAVGDKMAGRHGNKGVVSRIMPIENMPYFEDGTPVDLVLNPLGVPSRMNVGQVLETHLGWAAGGLGRQIGKLIETVKVDALRKKIEAIFSPGQYKTIFADMPDEELLRFTEDYRSGVHMSTPVFDGAEESQIRKLLAEAGLSETGQTTLYDGRTGEPFDWKVTVGVMYMMKLHHLVDDKIHARSTGPYSLVTQQPLGGKAQFGGQRLGEMEVWAMEAYGAAYSLQEFLTVKSDDVAGRTRMYERIVKGNNILEAGLPESFNVLVKELQGLSLDIDLVEED